MLRKIPAAFLCGGYLPNDGSQQSRPGSSACVFKAYFGATRALNGYGGAKYRDFWCHDACMLDAADRPRRLWSACHWIASAADYLNASGVSGVRYIPLVEPNISGSGRFRRLLLFINRSPSALSSSVGDYALAAKSKTETMPPVASDEDEPINLLSLGELPAGFYHETLTNPV